MSFSSPAYLLGLLALAPAVGGYVWLQRHRRRQAARFGNPALHPNLVDRSPGPRRHLPAAVLLLALTVLLVGAAKPQASLSVRRKEATVVLALDVSRSMVATDVKPTRLAAEQAAAREFVAKLPSTFRVGVVAFATRAQVVVPATDDRETVLAAIGALRPGLGTAVGDAILRSIQAGRAATPDLAPGPGRRSPIAVLLLSDGAQTQGPTTPQQAAARARALAIPISTIALGTPGGVVTRTLPGGFTERIAVPPDPATLRGIAATTGGTFFAAPSSARLGQVYAQLRSRLGHERGHVDVSYAFAAGGLGLALLAGALSALWFRRAP